MIYHDTYKRKIQKNVVRYQLSATVKLLFQLSEYRLELYYAFGILCLASWFAFNLWILRDYFFPCWFKPIYTETGLSKQKLQLKKQEIMMRNRVSVAFVIPAQIGVPIGGDQMTHSSAGRSTGQQRAQSVTTANSTMLPLTKQRYSLEASRQILDVDRYSKTQYCSKTPLLARNTSNDNINFKMDEKNKIISPIIP